MAAVKDKFIVSNPTLASVTVCGVAIPAGAVREVEAKEEIKENSEGIYKAVCAGCTVTTGLLKNKTGEVGTVTAKVSTFVTLGQQGATLLQELIRSTVSVGSDAHAEYGE